MTTPFEWISAGSEPIEDKQMARPCLLWVWDKDIRIGYVNDGLAYWLGGRWVDRDERPILTHPDIACTYWCYVSEPKSRRKP